MHLSLVVTDENLTSNPLSPNRGSEEGAPEPTEQQKRLRERSEARSATLREIADAVPPEVTKLRGETEAQKRQKLDAQVTAFQTAERAKGRSEARRAIRQIRSAMPPEVAKLREEAEAEKRQRIDGHVTKLQAAINAPLPEGKENSRAGRNAEANAPQPFAVTKGASSPSSPSAPAKKKGGKKRGLSNPLSPNTTSLLHEGLSGNSGRAGKGKRY